MTHSREWAEWIHLPFCLQPIHCTAGMNDGCELHIAMGMRLVGG